MCGVSNSKPRARGLTFEPEYAEQDGIKHEFTGSLYIPAPGESERCETERQSREPELNPVCIAAPLIEKPYRSDWTTRRVKMSAGEMIRLNAR